MSTHEFNFKTMKLANLDSLRGVAALIVIAFHINGEYPGFLPKLASFGWVGVDLFFVISGAVIAHSANDLYESGQADWKWKYAVRRFTRIYPLFFVTSIVFLVVSGGFWMQSSHQITLQIVTHLAMMHSFFPDTFHGLNHVTWSLAIEVQYYILAALVVKWITQVSAVRIISLAVVLAFVWNSFFYNIFSGDASIMHFYLSQLPGRIDEFAWGVVIWRLWKTEDFKKYLALNVWTRAGLAVLTVAIGLTIFLSWTQAVSGQTSAVANFGLLIHTGFGDTGVRLLIGALCGLVVLGTTLLPEQRYLNPTEYLGRISYGLYLWHPIAIILVSKYIASSVYAISAVLATTFLLSIASYGLIEMRFRRWLLELFK